MRTASNCWWRSHTWVEKRFKDEHLGVDWYPQIHSRLPLNDLTFTPNQSPLKPCFTSPSALFSLTYSHANRCQHWRFRMLKVLKALNEFLGLQTHPVRSFKVPEIQQPSSMMICLSSNKATRTIFFRKIDFHCWYWRKLAKLRLFRISNTLQ